MGGRLVFVFLLLVTLCQSKEKFKYKLEVPKLDMTGNWLSDGGGSINGAQGTIDWSPADNSMSLSGTAGWQHGSGFSGSVSGSVQVSDSTSFDFGVDSGGNANIGVSHRFKRRRRGAHAQRLIEDVVYKMANHQTV